MNEKLKHTPGPWKILPEEVGRNYIRIRGAVLGSKYKIANILHAEGDLGNYHKKEAIEVRANARLIATAPEFLEDKIKDFNGIGKWLSAALEDPNVCNEMKQDIREWFDRFNTLEKATGLKIEEII